MAVVRRGWQPQLEEPIFIDHALEARTWRKKQQQQHRDGRNHCTPAVGLSPAPDACFFRETRYWFG